MHNTVVHFASVFFSSDTCFKVKFPAHIDTKNCYIERKCLWQLIMVGRLLQNLTMYICMQESILNQIQHRISSFNDYIHSTSTRTIFGQDKYLFNFNTDYFWARQIFIQLKRPKLCFRKRIYLFNFNKKIFSFNKTYFFNSRTSISFCSTKLHLPIPPPCVRFFKKDNSATWKQHA